MPNNSVDPDRATSHRIQVHLRTGRTESALGKMSPVELRQLCEASFARMGLAHSAIREVDLKTEEVLKVLSEKTELVYRIIFGALSRLRDDLKNQSELLSACMNESHSRFLAKDYAKAFLAGEPSFHARSKDPFGESGNTVEGLIQDKRAVIHTFDTFLKELRSSPTDVKAQCRRMLTVASVGLHFDLRRFLGESQNEFAKIEESSALAPVAVPKTGVLPLAPFVFAFGLNSLVRSVFGEFDTYLPRTKLDEGQTAAGMSEFTHLVKGRSFEWRKALEFPCIDCRDGDASGEAPPASAGGGNGTIVNSSKGRGGSSPEDGGKILRFPGAKKELNERKKDPGNLSAGAERFRTLLERALLRADGKSQFNQALPELRDAYRDIRTEEREQVFFRVYKQLASNAEQEAVINERCVDVALELSNAPHEAVAFLNKFLVELLKAGRLFSSEDLLMIIKDRNVIDDELEVAWLELTVNSVIASDDLRIITHRVLSSTLEIDSPRERHVNDRMHRVESLLSIRELYPPLKGIFESPDIKRSAQDILANYTDMILNSGLNGELISDEVSRIAKDGKQLDTDLSHLVDWIVPHARGLLEKSQRVPEPLRKIDEAGRRFEAMSLLLIATGIRALEGSPREPQLDFQISRLLIRAMRSEKIDFAVANQVVEYAKGRPEASIIRSELLIPRIISCVESGELAFAADFIDSLGELSESERGLLENVLGNVSNPADPGEREGLERALSLIRAH